MWEVICILPLNRTTGKEKELVFSERKKKSQLFGDGKLCSTSEGVKQRMGFLEDLNSN